MRHFCTHCFCRAVFKNLMGMEGEEEDQSQGYDRKDDDQQVRKERKHGIGGNLVWNR